MLEPVYPNTESTRLTYASTWIRWEGHRTRSPNANGPSALPANPQHLSVQYTQPTLCSHTSCPLSYPVTLSRWNYLVLQRETEVIREELPRILFFSLRDSAHHHTFSLLPSHYRRKGIFPPMAAKPHLLLFHLLGPYPTKHPFSPLYIKCAIGITVMVSS